MQTEYKILEKFIHSHTGEALAVLEKYEDQDIVNLLEELPIPSSAQLLSQMDRFRGARILELIDLSRGANLIEQIPVPVVVMLLRLLEDTKRSSILNILPQPLATTIRKTLSYPENTAGAYIETNIFTLYQDSTVGEVLHAMKSQSNPVYSEVYVLDRDQSLVGLIELRELIITDPEKKISSIMNGQPFKILGNTKISAVIEIEKLKTTFDNLPVVDAKGGFLGILTRESITKLVSTEKPMDRQAHQASTALGDLYKIGLSGLFHSGTNIS